VWVVLCVTDHNKVVMLILKIINKNNEKGIGAYWTPWR